MIDSPKHRMVKSNTFWKLRDELTFSIQLSHKMFYHECFKNSQDSSYLEICPGKRVVMRRSEHVTTSHDLFVMTELFSKSQVKQNKNLHKRKWCQYSSFNTIQNINQGVHHPKNLRINFEKSHKKKSKKSHKGHKLKSKSQDNLVNFFLQMIHSSTLAKPGFKILQFNHPEMIYFLEIIALRLK